MLRPGVSQSGTTDGPVEDLLTEPTVPTSPPHRSLRRGRRTHTVETDPPSPSLPCRQTVRIVVGNGPHIKGSSTNVMSYTTICKPQPHVSFDSSYNSPTTKPVLYVSFPTDTTRPSPLLPGLDLRRSGRVGERERLEGGGMTRPGSSRRSAPGSPSDNIVFSIP